MISVVMLAVASSLSTPKWKGVSHSKVLRRGWVGLTTMYCSSQCHLPQEALLGESTLYSSFPAMSPSLASLYQGSECQSAPSPQLNHQFPQNKHWFTPNPHAELAHLPRRGRKQ